MVEVIPMGFLLEDREMDGRHEVKREVVWNCECVDILRWQHGRCNVELGVIDMVRSWEYPAIVARAREYGFSIVNPRDHPYYPRVMWIEVDTLEQVAFLTPYYDGEIVLISVVPNVSPILYQDIVFHATAKGFIVLNTGPWRKGAFIPSDNAVFEAQLLEVETHISWEIRKREEAEASIDGMKNSLARDTSVLNLNAKEYADAKGISESVIEAKRKKISQLENRLTLYRGWIEKLKMWTALTTSEEEWPGSSLKSSEVFRSLIMVGDAFKLWHNSQTKVESAHPVKLLRNSHTKVESAFPESESVAEIEEKLVYDTETSEDEWPGSSPRSSEDFRSLIMVGDAVKLLHNSHTKIKSAYPESESFANKEEKVVHNTEISEDEWPGSSPKSGEDFRSLIMVGDAVKLLNNSHTKVNGAHPESESFAEIEEKLVHDRELVPRREVPKLWRWRSMGIACLGLSILGFLYRLQAGQRKSHLSEVLS